MKNRGLTIFLVIAVCLIWGLLAYKLFHSLHSENMVPKTSSVEYPKKVQSGLSYQLHHYNRDPFLSILTDTVTEPPTPEIKIVKPIERKPIQLPEYCGMIQSSQKKLAVFLVNKKYIFVNQGEKINSLKVKVIAPDSVVVRGDDGEICIRLQKKK